MNTSLRPTLLVLRHHGLGDLLTVQPALRGLRRHFSRHRLLVTCPSWLVPLGKSFGSADQLISEVANGSGSTETEFDPASHQQVDSALLANVMNAVPKADVLISLRTPGTEVVPIVEALQPRLFVSYHHEALQTTAGYPELDFSDHILERWRRLLGAIGISLRDEDLYAEMEPPDSLRGFTVVHAGAGSPARLWPIDRWAEVVGHLAAKGHRVVLTGSKSEMPRVAEICRKSGLPAECDRSGRTGVMELAQLAAGARLVICTDTGISHLATTFRRPAISLFGPIPPAWWGPPPGNPQHKTIWSGRLGDNYTSQPDEGLMKIPVDTVLRLVDELEEEGILDHA